jgi:hypothetical protein
MTTRVTTATTVATMAIISPAAKPDELGVDVVVTVGGFSEFVSGRVEDVIGIVVRAVARSSGSAASRQL